MADAGILGAEESQSQTFLWQEQDSISRGFGNLFVVVVVVGVVTPGMLCCSFLSWNHGPMGQGGRRTAPGLGPVTTPPEGAAQGPRARLASPILAGKGIARGQLFTVKGSPFLPAQQVFALAR